MVETIAGWTVFFACAALVWGSGFMAGRLSSPASPRTQLDREETSDG
jgi:hypothetical protein